MALFENDYDVYGMMFKLAIENLDSVKGVVDALQSTDDVAKKVRGSLVDVGEMFDVASKSGKTLGESVSWIESGGNHFVRFSQNAQEAARQVRGLFGSWKEEYDKVKSSGLPEEEIKQQVTGLVYRYGQHARMVREKIRGMEGPDAVQSTIAQLGSTRPQISLKRDREELDGQISAFFASDLGQIASFGRKFEETQEKSNQLVDDIRAKYNRAAAHINSLESAITGSIKPGTFSGRISEAFGAINKTLPKYDLDPQLLKGHEEARAELEALKRHANESNRIADETAQVLTNYQAQVVARKIPQVLRRFPRGIQPLDALVDVEARGSQMDNARAPFFGKNFYKLAMSGKLEDSPEFQKWQNAEAMQVAVSGLPSFDQGQFSKLSDSWTDSKGVTHSISREIESRKIYEGAMAHGQKTEPELARQMWQDLQPLIDAKKQAGLGPFRFGAWNAGWDIPLMTQAAMRGQSTFMPEYLKKNRGALEFGAAEEPFLALAALYAQLKPEQASKVWKGDLPQSVEDLRLRRGWSLGGLGAQFGLVKNPENLHEAQVDAPLAMIIHNRTAAAFNAASKEYFDSGDVDFDKIIHGLDQGKSGSAQGFFTELLSRETPTEFPRMRGNDAVKNISKLPEKNQILIQMAKSLLEVAHNEGIRLNLNAKPYNETMRGVITGVNDPEGRPLGQETEPIRDLPFDNAGIAELMSSDRGGPRGLQGGGQGSRASGSDFREMSEKENLAAFQRKTIAEQVARHLLGAAFADNPKQTQRTYEQVVDSMEEKRTEMGMAYDLYGSVVKPERRNRGDVRTDEEQVRAIMEEKSPGSYKTPILYPGQIARQFTPEEQADREAARAEAILSPTPEVRELRNKLDLRIAEINKGLVEGLAQLAPTDLAKRVQLTAKAQMDRETARMQFTDESYAAARGGQEAADIARQGRKLQTQVKAEAEAAGNEATRRAYQEKFGGETYESRREVIQTDTTLSQHERNQRLNRLDLETAEILKSGNRPDQEISEEMGLDVQSRQRLEKRIQAQQQLQQQRDAMANKLEKLGRPGADKLRETTAGDDEVAAAVLRARNKLFKAVNEVPRNLVENDQYHAEIKQVNEAFRTEIARYEQEPGSEKKVAALEAEAEELRKKVFENRRNQLYASIHPGQTISGLAAEAAAAQNQGVDQDREEVRQRAMAGAILRMKSKPVPPFADVEKDILAREDLSRAQKETTIAGLRGHYQTMLEEGKGHDSTKSKAQKEREAREAREQEQAERAARIQEIQEKSERETRERLAAMRGPRTQVGESPLDRYNRRIAERLAGTAQPLKSAPIPQPQHPPAVRQPGPEPDIMLSGMVASHRNEYRKLGDQWQVREYDSNDPWRAVEPETQRDLEHAQKSSTPLVRKPGTMSTQAPQQQGNPFLDRQTRGAYVFDIDKTLLSHEGLTDKSLPAFYEWAKKSNAKAVEVTRAIFDDAVKSGHEIHLITARGAELREATIKNLRAAGFGNFTSLTTAPDPRGFQTYDQVAEFKANFRKKLFESGRDVLLNVGDTDPDFKGGYYRKGIDVVGESELREHAPTEDLEAQIAAVKPNPLAVAQERQRLQRDAQRAEQERREEILRLSATPPPGGVPPTPPSGGEPPNRPSRKTYEEIRAENEQLVRTSILSGIRISGGSGAGSGPGGASPRRTSSSRLENAKRAKAVADRQRARIFQDARILSSDVTDKEVFNQNKVTEAILKTNQAAERLGKTRAELPARKAAKELDYEQSEQRITDKMLADEEKANITIGRMILKRNELQAKKFDDIKGTTERKAAEDKNLREIGLMTRGIELMKTSWGTPADLEKGIPAETGTRFRDEEYRKEKAAKRYAESLAAEDARVQKAEEDLRAASVAETETTRARNYSTEKAKRNTSTRARRRSEDSQSRMDAAQAALEQAEAAEAAMERRNLERDFSRKSETLQDVLNRTGDPDRFLRAKRSEEETLRENAYLPERLPRADFGVVNVPENQSKSYKKLKDTILNIDQELENKRLAYVAAEAADIERLASLKIKAEEAPAALRSRANALLGANRTLAEENLLSGQATYNDAEKVADQKRVKAHAKYDEDFKREQEIRARSLSANTDNSILALTAQFAGALYVVKNFVAEMVLYAARTDTMKIVTEQMAKTNGINTQALLSQVTAIKSLNITTQEAHETVQKMMFAQLDVAKATQLARVAQDAATISGEYSSVALSKIITGITTGQTRQLHYMGLQVSMMQVMRQATEELGRAPTEVEKRQYLLNAVLDQGIKIAGNYDAAMLTAGKQMLSLKRQFQEAENAVGKEFQPALLSGISLLSKFAAMARENTSEFATMTRAIGAVVSALLVYQGIRLAQRATEGVGSSILKSLALRPAGLTADVEGPAELAPVGSVANIVNRARSGGVLGALGATGAFLGRIPIGPALIAGTAAYVGYKAFTESDTNDLTAVRNSITSLKSQNQRDILQLDIQHRTGEIDDQTYAQSRKRFFDQDNKMASLAEAQVSQVWIDRAKKVAEDQEQFAGDYKNDPRAHAGFFKGTALGLNRLYTSLIHWDTYRDLGLSWLEGATSRHAGESTVDSELRKGGIDKEKEFDARIANIRKQIKEKGDYIIQDGAKTIVVSLETQLKNFDAGVAAFKSATTASKDPLYNVRLMLEQEIADLDTAGEDKLRKNKEKIEELSDRIIKKSIVDPVAKIYDEMEDEVKKYDIQKKQLDPIFEKLTRLGLGPENKIPAYDRYVADRKELEGLKVTQADSDSYRNFLAREAELGKKTVGPLDPRASDQRALSYGFTPEYVAKLRRFDALNEDIKKLETDQRGPQGEIIGSKDFGLRSTAEQERDQNALFLRQIREVEEKAAIQEEMIRRHGYEAKGVEYRNQLAEITAPLGGGVEQQRRLATEASQAAIENENKASRERLEYIAKYADAEKQGLQIQSELEVHNERRLELDRARILALEKINEVQREEGQAFDISKIDSRLKLEEEIASVQIDGFDKTMELAAKKRDLELDASAKIFAEDGKVWEQRKRDAQTIDEYNKKDVQFAKQRADQAKDEIKALIQTQSQRTEQLRTAAAIGPYAENSAARANFEQRKADIEVLYAFEDDKKEANKKRDKEIADAQFEYLKQRMDVYKKQLEEGRKAAGQVFDALTAKGTGGVRQLMEGLFKTTEKQIFENLFQGLFTGLGRTLTIPGQGTMAHPTFLGKALEGTLFGLKDDPREEIKRLQAQFAKDRDASAAVLAEQKELTSETARNTTATDRLTEAIDRFRELTKAINDLKVVKAPGTLPTAAQMFANVQPPTGDGKPRLPNAQEMFAGVTNIPSTQVPDVIRRIAASKDQEKPLPLGQATKWQSIPVTLPPDQIIDPQKVAPTIPPKQQRSFLDEASARVSEVESSIVRPISHAAGSIVRPISDAMGSIAGPIRNAASSIASGVTNAIDQYRNPAKDEAARQQQIADVEKNVIPKIKGAGKMYWETPDFLKTAKRAVSDEAAVAYSTFGNEISDAKSMVTSPKAMSRFTRTPLYFYDDATNNTGGFASLFTGHIFVNKAYPEMQKQAIAHESVHVLVGDSLTDLVKDPYLTKYLPEVRKGLNADSALYRGKTDASILSEAMAYGSASGSVPGLNAVESRAFLVKASRDLDEKTRSTFLRLAPFVAQPPTISLRGRSKVMATDDEILAHEGIPTSVQEEAARQAQIADVEKNVVPKIVGASKMFWQTPDLLKAPSVRPSLTNEQQLERFPVGSVQRRIVEEAIKQGVSPAQALGFAQSESGFNPFAWGHDKEGKTSERYGYGVFQLIPSTAKGLGVDRMDPGQNIEGGIRGLKEATEKAHGNFEQALYNYKGGAAAEGGGWPGVRQAQKLVSEYDAGTNKFAPVPMPGTSATSPLTPSEPAPQASKDDLVPPDLRTLPPEYVPMADPKPYVYDPKRIPAPELEQKIGRTAGIASRFFPAGSPTAIGLGGVNQVLQGGKFSWRDILPFPNAFRHRTGPQPPVDPSTQPYVPPGTPAWLRRAMILNDQTLHLMPRVRPSPVQQAAYDWQMSQYQQQMTSRRQVLDDQGNVVGGSGITYEQKSPLAGGMGTAGIGTPKYPAGSVRQADGSVLLPSGALRLSSGMIDRDPRDVALRQEALYGPPVEDLRQMMNPPLSSSSSSSDLEPEFPQARAGLGFRPIPATSAVDQLGSSATPGEQVLHYPTGNKPGTWTPDPPTGRAEAIAINAARLGVAIAKAAVGGAGGGGAEAGVEAADAEQSAGDFGGNSAADSSSDEAGSVSQADLKEMMGPSLSPEDQGSMAHDMANRSMNNFFREPDQQSKAGAVLGAAGDIGAKIAAGFDAVKQFKRGGAYGALGGIQDVASMIPGGEIIGFAAGLARAILGDPREKYRKELEKELKREKFYEPDVQNRIMNTSGQEIDFDAWNTPRQGAPLTSGPTVIDPAYSLRYENSVGSMQNAQQQAALNPIGGNPVNLHVNVSTMDSRSFLDNSGLIAHAMRKEIMNNHPIVNDLRQVSGVS